MIHLAPADLAIIGIYLLFTILVGMGFHRYRGSGTEDYLVAGRNVSLPAFVATLVATWYGGILGVGEFTYTSGLFAWLALGIPYYIFAAVFALVLAHRVRSARLFTIPDRLEHSFGRTAAGIGSLLVFVMVSPAPYVLMLGVLLQIVSGWPLWACIVIGSVLSSFWVANGGLYTDIRVNIFQFVLMFLGFAIILPAAVSQLGGAGFLQKNLPPEFLTLTGGAPTQTIVVWFMIAVWTLVDPGFHQRCYAARTPSVARNGILVSICCWMVFDALTISTGLYARAALPDLSDPKMSYPMLAELVLGSGFKGLFYVGMLATVMSTVLSYTFLSAVTLGRDVTWRFRGGSEDAVPGYTRWGLVFTGVLAVTLALGVPSVVSLWYMLGNVCVPGLLVPVLASYLLRRPMSPGGAVLCMLSGFGTALVWLVIGQLRAEGGWPSYPLGLEPMIPGLLISTLVLVFAPKRSPG